MTRIGVLGGTFDPIHLGHLDVADAARTALGLARILLVPSRMPPHRRPPTVSPAHRFAMTALAAQAYPHLLVSDLEMDDAAPSYTAATLDRLAGRGVDTTRLFLITGADAFRDIGTWKDFPGLLDRCHFVVVSRPGHAAPALRAALPDLAARMLDAPCAVPPRPAILLVDAATAPVSSTHVRQQLRAGATIEGLVPPPVAAYIGKHHLYTDAPSKDFE